MAQHAELEITLRRKESSGYPIELRSVAIGSDTEERIPATGTAYAAIDPSKLVGLEPNDYGKQLGQWLFDNKDILVGFEKARDSLNASNAAGKALRIRLYIDAGAEELHTLHWETLCDPKGAPLFQGEEVVFSRYLASSNWYAPRAKTALKALIVIADPKQPNANDPESFKPGGANNVKMAPVKVAEERQRAEEGFRKANIETKVVATGEADSLGPATLANILDQLDQGYDILYLVCHGALMHDGVARVWLEDDLHDASKIVDRVRTKTSLRMVVLVSCESGGAGAQATLSAIGPMLVDAGVPAVIAMQGKVQMATIAKFMPALFRNLSKLDGQIDRAMGAARQAAVDGDCPDFWMPVLFMRLITGRLWYVPGITAGDGRSEQQTWDRIHDAFSKGRITPILGFGALEGVIGATARELAREMAGTQFPFSSTLSEDLPAVAQFMSIWKGRSLSVKQDLAVQLMKRLPRVEGLDPEKPENLSQVLSAAGKAARAANPLDPYRVLASRPFTVYLTTNPDSLLEDALREAGRNPHTDFCRWNKDPDLDLRNHARYPTLREREPNYIEPTVQDPLVYHLFGLLDLPRPAHDTRDTPDPKGVASRAEAGIGSFALTEDDFFSYLLNIGAKADAKDDIPGPVNDALAANSLLFLGFRQDDWSFRVLLRSIYSKEGSGARGVGNLAFPCVGAQIQPEENRVSRPENASRYFEQYLRDSKIDIFWGNTQEFVEAFERNTTGFALKKSA